MFFRHGKGQDHLFFPSATTPSKPAEVYLCPNCLESSDTLAHSSSHGLPGWKEAFRVEKSTGRPI